MSNPVVAVFRPADGRLSAAVSVLESYGLDVVGDPMLAVAPTGAVAREDADVYIVTSTTGAALLDESGWEPNDGVVCAIGDETARALRDAGYSVELVPGVFSSKGLVSALTGRVDGVRVEIARSDHGSKQLRDGLDEAEAFHHETVLYRLVRPDDSGESVQMAAEGALDGVVFTSSLTVEHFLEIASEQDLHDQVIDGVNTGVVGVIGEPTRETAENAGIRVDVVASTATFDSLAAEVAAALESS